jgi:hypothetical protein
MSLKNDQLSYQKVTIYSPFISNCWNLLLPIDVTWLDILWLIKNHYRVNKILSDKLNWYIRCNGEMISNFNSQIALSMTNCDTCRSNLVIYISHTLTINLLGNEILTYILQYIPLDIKCNITNLIYTSKIFYHLITKLDTLLQPYYDIHYNNIFNSDFIYDNHNINIQYDTPCNHNWEYKYFKCHMNLSRYHSLRYVPT